MILNEGKVDGFGCCLYYFQSIKSSNIIDDLHRVEGELLSVVSQATDRMTLR